MNVYLGLCEEYVSWEKRNYLGATIDWLWQFSSRHYYCSLLLQSQVEKLQAMRWVGPQKQSWVNEIKHVLKSFWISIQNWWRLWWWILSFHCVSVQYRPLCLLFGVCSQSNHWLTVNGLQHPLRMKLLRSVLAWTSGSGKSMMMLLW